MLIFISEKKKFKVYDLVECYSRIWYVFSALLILLRKIMNKKKNKRNEQYRHMIHFLGGLCVYNLKHVRMSEIPF